MSRLRLVIAAALGRTHPRDAARAAGLGWTRRRHGPSFDPSAPRVVLSPHYDDAVLSCWSALTSPGDLVVANVFTASPAAGVLGPYDRVAGASSARELMALRALEDEAALGLAARDGVPLGLREAQYRSRAPAADELLDRLADRVPAVSSVLAPAGIGGHPDHLLAREAALRLGRSGVRIAFYAELPYSVAYGWPRWVTGTSALPHLDVDAHWAPALQGLRPPDAPDPLVIRLDDAAQSAKLAALRTYATQYPTLSRGPLDVLSHPAVIGWEVVWPSA